MTQITTPVKTPGGARVPLPEAQTPAVRRLIEEARGLAHRIASGERGPAIEAAVDEWHRAWHAATADPGHVGGGRWRT